jgi:Bardet-Biedl syndrome 9 protein
MFLVDVILVQSLDGFWTVIESCHESFSKTVPNFLLPGPLAYIPGADLIVTYSSQMQLEAYRYETLVNAADGGAPGTPGGLKSPLSPTGPKQKKAIAPEWSFVLGEAVTDVQVGRWTRKLSRNEQEILVLGERTFFVFTTTGQLRYSIRMEIPPSCMISYNKAVDQDAPADLQNLIMVTGNLLSVLDGNRLVWAAKTNLEPVAVRVLAKGYT